MTTMLTAIDPSTGQPVREVPAAGPVEIETTLERAETAYHDWRRAGFAERAQLLRAVGAELRRGVEDYAYVMTEEMGKPITEARGEVIKAAWAAEHYADHGEQYLAAETVESDATSSYVQYLPIGPVLGVLPWNAPFWLAFRFCAPALMAGNTAVMKHDPHVPGCAAAIAGAIDADESVPPVVAARWLLGEAHHGAGLPADVAGLPVVGRDDQVRPAPPAWAKRLCEAEGGYLLLDTQFLTTHLARFGAIEVGRDPYRALLAEAVSRRSDFFALDRPDPAVTVSGPLSGNRIAQLLTQTS